MLSSNSACERLENVTTTIATKDLAWRLYHSEKTVSQLQATEDAIALAMRTFGVRAATYLLLTTFCLDSYYSSTIVVSLTLRLTPMSTTPAKHGSAMKIPSLKSSTRQLEAMEQFWLL
jgi:hypothetical protein